jgi:hypothetical protein
MKKLSLLTTTALTTTVGLIFGSVQSASALIWDWNYSGTGITASGTFITNDIPDNFGYYLMTGITGQRNGDTITGLFPAGSPIPGNEPFEVDNLIKINPQQLTGDGFGYSTAGGNFVSPFFASFLPVPGYLEVFSAPPFIPGFENFGPEDTELDITFSATIRTVPESSSGIALVAVFGLMGARQFARSKCKSK